MATKDSRLIIPNVVQVSYGYRDRSIVSSVEFGFDFKTGTKKDDARERLLL